MANDMKRVGLVFTEDGSVNFTKSLNLVNAALRENYQNFKLVQSQWDSSTSSTQKLKSKLDYLNNAYDIQQDKVTTLRKQLEELENAENKDEVAIQKKKAALAQAETSLQKYKNQIDETTSKLKTGSQRIEEYATKVKGAGEKIEKAGKKMSAFSSASVAALAASAAAAIEFESSFTGVEKTVDATDEQFEKMKKQVREMAKEIPATTTEINGVAEAAGQLGIKAEDIMSFTRVMIDLGNSTNLTADEAATSLAKFANVTKMSADNYSNLGSVVVALGNNFATTERDIVEMSTRLAATGELTGLTQAQIMALATAMSSVGIEAEAGGSAMSKLLKIIQLAVETGTSKMNDLTTRVKQYGYSISDVEKAVYKGGNTLKTFAGKVGMSSKELKGLFKEAQDSANGLEDFASVANMSSAEFAKAFKENAVGALSAFLGGLNDTERNGRSAIAILDDMGLTEVRLSNTILSLANASGVMNDAVDLANKSWNENNALTNEANKRYETLKSKLQIALQKIMDMGITLGNKLMPKIESIIGTIGNWINKFNDLNDEQVNAIVNIGLVIAALGPAISIIGKFTTVIGGSISAFGMFKEAINVAMGAATSAKTSVNMLATVFSAITGPIGLACTAIAAGITVIALTSNKAAKEAEEDFNTMGNAATDFLTGIDNAKSHLNEFNSTLFASTEEQQNLKTSMNEVQKGITEICQRASSERRSYTEGEIKQLEEYFSRLRELKNRELEIQQSISNAIAQQATQNAQTFQGSLEEYKVQSQEWIKTAKDQKEQEVTIINERTTQEIALLQQKYGEKATLENEEYAREYNAIIQNKDTAIAQANEKVGKVNEAYAVGYAQRSEQENGFYTTLQASNALAEQENARHTARLDEINNSWYATEDMRRGAIEGENARHNQSMNGIWTEMYKNLDETQAQQLGSWIAMLSNTEVYGGEIDDESRKMVNSMLQSYDSMPKKTRESMKNAMTPMLDEMQKKEPSLFAKASGIATGILTRLNKAFDIHSPSRKTRKIMRYAMQPMEEEMEEGKKELFHQADEIGKGINDRLSIIDSSGYLKFKTSTTQVVRRDNIIESENNIDYDKLYVTILKALNSCKLKIDRDGFAKLIDNRLLEVL